MPFIDIAQVKDKSFDYIIAGGGTAGLVVAARLSENPKVTVLVIDAGHANLKDPLIMQPGQYGATFTKPSYDWGFMTVPQKHSNEKQLYWPRGKSLGGSSALNFAVWSVPNAVDIEAWGKLNKGEWSFERYQKYLDGIASYQRPTPDNQIEKYPQEVAERWMRPSGKGPVQIAHPKRVLDLQVKFQETFEKMGIPRAPAPNAGDSSGHFICPSTLSPETNDRSYSATAFFEPHKSRPNYQVLMGAHVQKLITSDEGALRVTGVEFLHDNITYIVSVDKEVVLCAGALKSPQILELSGIGKPDVLKKAGIPLKLQLDGVGQNVQEHMHIGLAYRLKDDITENTYDVLLNPGEHERQAELFKQGEGTHMLSIHNYAYLPLAAISSRAKELIEEERIRISRSSEDAGPGLKEQYNLLLDKLEQNAPGCELIGFPGYMSAPVPPEPGAKYASLLAATNYNLSRGTIHVRSADPAVQPVFDPHTFERDIDIQTLLDMVKYLREMAKTAPLADYLGSAETSEVNPGPAAQTDDELIAWIKNNVRSTFHTAGSLSMLPREKNGVVDTDLKVYGTSNVRVADLSVVPLHFSAHSVSTAYVIGACAAESIQKNL